MVVTGKEIYIQVDYSGLGDWYTLAGSKSCQIKGDCEEIEIASPDTGEWSTTRHFIGMTATEFSVTNVPEGTIEVIVRYNQATGGSPQRLLSIGEMTLKEDQKIWSDYTVDKEQDAVINNTNGFGIGEETVDNLFSLKRKDSNSLRPDSNINPPTYPYLMQTQQRRVVRYALKALNLHKVNHPYILPWKDTDGTMYRIIARSFTPIDDEMILVLHHSPVFTQ